MTTFRLALKYEQKYQLTSHASPDLARLENSVRHQLDALWQIPNKSFNILRACADSEASKPQNDNEKLAVEGYHLCRRVVSLADYLKANRDSLSLSDIRESLNKMLAFIAEAQKDGLFPSVSELIFQLMPSGRKYDRKVREQEYAKARKGLSRMNSLALTILNEMNRAGGANQQEGRFDPKGAELSEEEIVLFIRQAGDKYGISDRQTWTDVVNSDPSLLPELTRLVHAVLRGHSPANGQDIKARIEDILKGRQGAKQTNQVVFDDNLAQLTEKYEEQR